MVKTTIKLGVGNAGLYRSLGALPDINQPDTLSVEKYIGAPFYAYMFLSSEKQKDLRSESVATLLSKPEAVNYYVERMSRDLKLQKASMAATLLRTTYVHMREMRKFIWQHNNAEKVIARDDHGYLPAFKKMLTRFVLLNYCAMNTPGVSGAEWVEEKHDKGIAFDAVDKAYKTEFKYFEWMGDNCRLRHPNPLNGHPKVNFSAFTDNMSKGRVFIMDVYKHKLVDEINRVNAQIFELLSQYLGSLSIVPTADELARDGVHYDVETPAVFEPIHAKETPPNVFINEAGEELDAAAMAARIAQGSSSSSSSGSAPPPKSEPKAPRGKKKVALPPAEEAAPGPTLEEAARAMGYRSEGKEFMEQEEGLKGGLALASVSAYAGSLDEDAVSDALSAAFEGSDIRADVIADRVQTLADALYQTAYFGSEEGAAREAAKRAAKDIIGRGLAAYTQHGKPLKGKSKGFVAFTKEGALSKIGASGKAGAATRIVRKMLARGKFNPAAGFDAI